MNPDDTPTLKVRFSLGTANTFGVDCGALAVHIACAASESGKQFLSDVSVLDARWSHPVAVWREKGGWGSGPKLTEFERGFVHGAKTNTRGTDDAAETIQYLINIIERITT